MFNLANEEALRCATKAFWKARNARNEALALKKKQEFEANNGTAMEDFGCYALVVSKGILHKDGRHSGG